MFCHTFSLKPTRIFPLYGSCVSCQMRYMSHKSSHKMTWHRGSWHTVLPQNQSFPGNSRLESSSPFVPKASVLTTCSPLSVSSLTLHCGVSVLYQCILCSRDTAIYSQLPTTCTTVHSIITLSLPDVTVKKPFSTFFHWCFITLLCSYWPKLSSNIFVTNHRHWCGRPDNSSHNNFPISCCFHKLHLGWINKSSRISFRNFSTSVSAMNLDFRDYETPHFL